MSDFQASPELLAIYLEDARQHLEALDHCLLTLEREGTDPEAVTAVLGPLHTLKGNSGMIGFPGIKDYVHRLEDVFARVHEGALALDREAFDRLFAGATALRDAIEQASREGREVRGLEAEKADLEGLMSEAARPPVTVAPPISVASAPAGPTAPTASLAPPRPAWCAWSSPSSTTC